MLNVSFEMCQTTREVWVQWAEDWPCHDPQLWGRQHFGPFDGPEDMGREVAALLAQFFDLHP